MVGEIKRRLTTILAADIVSYSKHMSTNEEGTLQTLKRHMTVIEPIVTAQNGRIFDTAGDAFLAEFKSTVEAVRAAIQIQEAVELSNQAPEVDPKLYFRIGINVGDVIDEEGRLYGDGINVACRLEGLANPGNICVSGSVYELVKNKLTYRFHAMGEQHVKNISEPIATFSLLSDYDANALNHLEIAAASGTSDDLFKSVLSTYKAPALIVLFLIIALVSLYFANNEFKGSDLSDSSGSAKPQTKVPSVSSSDIVKQQIAMPDLSGKWLVGTDKNQNVGIALKLLQNNKANIVLHNLKTSKTQKIKKQGNWRLTNDELCITVPVRNLETCFKLNETDKGIQLGNKRSTEIDWLLVDDTKF